MIEKEERPDHPARVEGQHPPDDETAAQITFALVDDAFDSHVPSGSLVSEIDDPATGIVTARKLFEGILFGPTPSYGKGAGPSIRPLVRTRTEERLVGKECVSRGEYRWSPYQ